MMVLRSARNGYLVLIVLLVVISIYQFLQVGTVRPSIAFLWIVGAGTFYLSKYKYRWKGNHQNAATRNSDQTE